MSDPVNSASPRKIAETGSRIPGEFVCGRTEQPPDAFSQIRGEFEAGATFRRLIVVIPMYREAKRIRQTIATLANSDLHRRDIGFCFVDDGSPDDTIEVADAAITEFGLHNSEICRLDRNYGKGGAVRLGVLHSAEASHFVGYLDADLSLNPAEVLTAMARLELTGSDALVGDRVVEVSQQPKLRRFSSLVFRWMAASLVPTGVSDSQCAMKLFRSDVATAVFGPLETTGFAFDVEVLARLKRDDYRVTETPVLWAHQPGSQVNALTDAVRMIREVLNIRRILRVAPVADPAPAQSA
jgi:dolichyl-phosphate beta-glucosyltransferase